MDVHSVFHDNIKKVGKWRAIRACRQLDCSLFVIVGYWIRLLFAVIQQSKSSEQTIMEIKNLIEDYKKQAVSQSLPKGHHVVDYLFSKPLYTYQDMAKKINIHRNTSDSYLNALHKAGVLKKTRFKREAVFYNPKFVKLL